MGPLRTVVETRAYTARAEKLLTLAEQEDVVALVSQDPLCGDLIEGTGGVRKVRFARAGKGKSGGVRVAYFFRDEGSPVFLLAIFGKNEKSNLTKTERNALYAAIKILKKQLRTKHEAQTK